MEIHFQTTDHVVAVEKVAEQHIGTKYSKCNSLRVISHIIIWAGSVADFSFRYSASVKPYRFRDTESRNCVLAYPQSNSPNNRK